MKNIPSIEKFPGKSQTSSPESTFDVSWFSVLFIEIDAIKMFFSSLPFLHKLKLDFVEI